MARDYAKISPRFWTGHTGRLIRAAGSETQVVALYLVSSPHSNMIGLYYLPTPTLCHETGLPPGAAATALGKLAELGFAFYDEAEEVVWVPGMARHQIAETLKREDKRVPAVEKEAAKYRSSRYYREFLERYEKAFCLERAPNPLPLGCPSDAPSKALPSQENEQEQIHEQNHEKKGEQDSCAEPEAAASAAEPPVITLPCVGTGAKEHAVTEADVASYREAFPGLNVLAELRRARAWLEANPTRRKTAKGMPRFLTAWLSRAQDHGAAAAPRVPWIHGDLGAEARPWPMKLTPEERREAQAELVAIAGPDFECAPLQATGNPGEHDVEAIAAFQDRWRKRVEGRP